MAPLTQTVRGIPSEVQLDPQSDGVSMACVVNLDNQTLARRTFLTTRMTTLRPIRMAEICTAQRAASGC